MTIDKKCFYKSLKHDYMSPVMTLLISSIIGVIIGYKYNHEILQLISNINISASHITLMALVLGTCWMLYETMLESPSQHEFINPISSDIVIFTIFHVTIFMIFTLMYCIYLCATEVGTSQIGSNYISESLTFTIIVYLITLVILPIARGIAICKEK